MEADQSSRAKRDLGLFAPRAPKLQCRALSLPAEASYAIHLEPLQYMSFRGMHGSVCYIALLFLRGDELQNLG